MVTTFVFQIVWPSFVCLSIVFHLHLHLQPTSLMHDHLAQAPARGGPIYCFIFYDSFLNCRVWSAKIFVNFYLVHSWRVLFEPLSPSSDGWRLVVSTFQRELLGDQRAQWQKILLQAFRDSKMILANTSTKDYRLNLYPYLCLLKDGEYIDIMIQVKLKV